MALDTINMPSNATHAIPSLTLSVSPSMRNIATSHSTPLSTFTPTSQTPHTSLATSTASFVDSTASSFPSALSPEALNGLAKSLPKYLIAGAIVFAILLLVGSISWYWKQRRRRSRFSYDEEWAGMKSASLSKAGWSRRSLESSEKMLKGRRGSDRSCGSETTSEGSQTPTKSCIEVRVDSAISTPVKEREAGTGLP